MMPDRSAERLAADIERALREAKERGDEKLVLTMPPELNLSAGEWRMILGLLKSSIGEDAGPTPQVGGPH